MTQLASTLRHCLLLLALGLTFAGAASAQEESVEDKARAHFRLGRAHYDNGNFAEAAVEFEEAYNVSQRAALLYNIYLAYRDANNTEKAAWSLKLYLEKEENIENRAQLQARLKALEEANAARAAAPATPVAAAGEQPADQLTETPAPEGAVEASEPPEKKSNLVPIILLSTGGAMVITSIATGIMASGKKSEAEDLCPGLTNCDPAQKQKLDDLESSQGTLAIVTDIMMFGGIAVAGTGAVLLVLNLMSGGGDEQQATVAYKPTASLACMPGACHGSMSMNF
jgi:tetratricopeptide (TPR) repeat protein